MNAGFLMIILMLPQPGEISAAFVNTATLEECEQRAKAVRAILTGQKALIANLVCRSSGARFEPFSHGTDSAARYSYIVAFDDKSATVVPKASGATCETKPVEPEAAAPARYCATSTQKILSEGN